MHVCVCMCACGEGEGNHLCLRVWLSMGFGNGMTLLAAVATQHVVFCA